MRTPWRFIADLVSRKPDQKRTDTPQIPALEHHQDETVRIEEAPPGEFAENENTANVTPASVAPPETVSHSAEVGTANIENDVPFVGSDAEGLGSDILPAVPEPPRETVEPPARPDKPKREKRPKEYAIENVVPTSNVVEPLLIPRTVFEEMAELDAEIAELRRQLARKLSQQNTWLKRMLERYSDR